MRGSGRVYFHNMPLSKNESPHHQYLTSFFRSLNLVPCDYEKQQLRRKRYFLATGAARISARGGGGAELPCKICLATGEACTAHAAMRVRTTTTPPVRIFLYFLPSFSHYAGGSSRSITTSEMHTSKLCIKI